MICCESPNFKHIEDLGHAESVDWDLERCLACGSYVLSESSENENAGVYCRKLTDEQAQKFQQTRGRDRIDLLKQWYNEH